MGFREIFNRSTAAFFAGALSIIHIRSLLLGMETLSCMLPLLMFGLVRLSSHL